MKTLILSTAALALGAGMALAQDTIRLGTEGAYPPFNLIDDKGEVGGFEREVGDELCKRAELTCEWVTNDWDSIIPNLVSGNYDVIIAGMSITDERDEVIDFSDPYTQPDPSAYIAMSDDMDMSNAVIAAQSGTIRMRAGVDYPIAAACTGTCASGSRRLNTDEQGAAQPVPLSPPRRRRLFGGALMTSGSFTMMAAGTGF